MSPAQKLFGLIHFAVEKMKCSGEPIFRNFLIRESCQLLPNQLVLKHFQIFFSSNILHVIRKSIRCNFMKKKNRFFQIFGRWSPNGQIRPKQGHPLKSLAHHITMVTSGLKTNKAKIREHLETPRTLYHYGNEWFKEK